MLTPDEQAAVNDLSSHIDVSPGRAVVTYHWSNFRHDPKQVLLKYFDGYFYLANWGTLRLMFRFPKGLLDEADIESYCMAEQITFETADRYQVLDLDFNPEDGEGWMAAEAGLSLFLPLRADLLAGDFRLLYLAWLKAMTLYGAVDEMGEPEYDDLDQLAYEREPPVPPGLKKLSPPLQDFVQVLEINPFLVQAAAEASPDPKKTTAPDYRTLIGRLSQDERADFLIRLAAGEAGVGLVLRKRLNAFLPQERSHAAKPRTIQQLVQCAKVLETAEQKRRAEEARKKLVADMKALAAREAQTWQQVDNLLAQGRKIASVYHEATGILERLKQLSEFQDRRDDFRARVRQLAQKYGTRPSLIERWRKRGWV